MQDLEGKIVSDRVYGYTAEQAALYALSTGFGTSADPRELTFTTEPSQRVSPTFLTVAIWDDTWLEREGLDLTHVVHGEQRVFLHDEPLPSGSLRGVVTIEKVFDKGRDKGALLFVRTSINDLERNIHLADLYSTIFARGNGGFGGIDGRTPELASVPSRAPDISISQTTLPQQALLYRLNGDKNPLHYDPDFARAAGFEKPILHGLCSFGIAAASIIKATCEYDKRRLRAFGCRFTGPIFPAETIETHIWQDGEKMLFRAISQERGVIVLDRGFAEFA